MYGTRTYMGGESTEAADAGIRSSCLWDHWITHPNPGNMIMYILSVVQLKIKPAVAPICID